MTSIKKPLPPYGKQLSEKKQMGKTLKNDIRLFIGHQCWRYAAGFRHSQAVLALPAHCDPSQYQWPVAGNSVLVTDCTFMTKQYDHALENNYIRKLSYTLLLEKATVVRVIYSNGKLCRYGGYSV